MVLQLFSSGLSFPLSAQEAKDPRPFSVGLHAACPGSDLKDWVKDSVGAGADMSYAFAGGHGRGRVSWSGEFRLSHTDFQDSSRRHEASVVNPALGLVVYFSPTFQGFYASVFTGLGVWSLASKSGETVADQRYVRATGEVDLGFRWRNGLALELQYQGSTASEVVKFHTYGLGLRVHL